MKRPLILVGAALVASLALAACAPSAPVAVSPTAAPVQEAAPTEAPVQEPAPTAAPAEEAAGLTPDQLRNAGYSGIYTETVTLTDGLYEGEPFVPDSAARPTVQYIDGSEVFGDLDGDGVEDAAVLLVESSGGSGTFTYVGAQLNQGGQPVDAGAVWIGDRTQVATMAITGGQVVLDIVTQGPDDAQCCPTLKVRKTLALQDGLLAEAGSEEQGTVSFADLDGTSWNLLELDTGVAVLPEAPITLQITGDQIGGSAGCNNYSGGVTVDGPQTITVGPLASTMMACEEPILNQEAAYLAALQAGDQWGYQAGNLVIVYPTEGNNVGRLLYAPAAPDAASAASPAEASADLTEAQLRNASVSGIYTETVTLTDGLYEGEPVGEGDASRPVVEFIDRSAVFGDLDGDGMDDAALLLLERTGGTGNFTYVAAQLNQSGAPVDAGSVRMEDAVQVQSMAIVDGQIVLDIFVPDFNNAQRAALLKQRKTFALQDGLLAEVSSEELGEVSFADLDGASWNLLELDTGVAVLPEAPITLMFAGDQISGSAGCNNYSGGVTPGATFAQEFTVGPLVSTMMACEEPISSQETAYLAALQAGYRWLYEAGHLVIFYPTEGNNFGRLLYAPTVQEAAAVPDTIAATYLCADGTSIDAVYDNVARTVTITLDGATLTLPQAVSASGARYSDETTTFWSKGDEAFVEVNGQIVHDQCSAQ
jgi:heat shock protein HslJ